MVLFLVSLELFAAEPKPGPEPNIASLLLIDFSTRSGEAQKNLLRQVALVGSPDVLPELGEIALDPRFDNDVRREALKAMTSLGGEQCKALWKQVFKERCLHL